MKTRRERPFRVNIVGADPVLVERIRASLGRSPFYFLDSPQPLPPDEVDLYAAPVDIAVGMSDGQAGKGAVGRPVIAFGRAGMMRSSFLAGCADYLREPWSPEELGLRALAALERVRGRFQFPWGALILEGTVLETPAGPVALTFHEKKILKALLVNRGLPVPRQALSYILWGGPGPAGSRAIDAHVSSIRKKVAAAVPAAGRLIRAVRREGYMVE